MKFKCVATIALAVGLVFIASCGTNLSGGVTLAQARATCLEWDNAIVAVGGFDTLVIIAESFRGDGLLQSEFIGIYLLNCYSDPDEADCKSCITQISAAVWN